MIIFIVDLNLSTVFLINRLVVCSINVKLLRNINQGFVKALNAVLTCPILSTTQDSQFTEGQRNQKILLKLQAGIREYEILELDIFLAYPTHG